MPHKETIISLQVLPSFCINSNFLSIKAAVNFYIDDLPGFMDSIEVEYDLWITKWKMEISRTIIKTNKLHRCSNFL